MKNVEIVSLCTVTRNNFFQREKKCEVPFQAIKLRRYCLLTNHGE